jgi:hypothetical protein
MASKTNKEIRDELYNKNSICKYCGCKMIKKVKGPIFPDSLCTINHFFSKINPFKNFAHQYLEICCNRCNFKLQRLDAIVFRIFFDHLTSHPILFSIYLVIYRNNPKKAYVKMRKLKDNKLYKQRDYINNTVLSIKSL